MNRPQVNSEVTQEQVQDLLERLRTRKQQLENARAQLRPLQENLELAEQEYKSAVNPLRREIGRLQRELAALNRQFERESDEPAVNIPDGDDHSRGEPDVPIVEPSELPVPPPADPESYDKDVLLEHLYRILDPLGDDDDARLLGELQGLCTEPGSGLADVLERVPWGKIWSERSSREALAEQYCRLESWERALQRQLDDVLQAEMRLRNDRSYGLWLQREKGARNWHNFLQQSKDRFRRDVEQLTRECDELRQRLHGISES
jgi:uncharacterized protein YukE